MVVTAEPATPTDGQAFGWYRAVLVAGWLALAVTALVAGHRQATLDDLERGIAAGRVDSVVLVGGPGAWVSPADPPPAGPQPAAAPPPDALPPEWGSALPPDALPAGPSRDGPASLVLTGPPDGPPVPAGPPGGTASPEAAVVYSQQVRWRDGLVARVADVDVRRAGDTTITTEGRQVVRRDVAADLAARHPWLRLDRDVAFTVGPEIAGWRLPGWTVVPVIVLAVAPVGLLIGGPEPWRVTRWGWFWLLGSPWTVLAFLVLSGPAPLVPAPRDPRRRLTGGWAFLLALVLGVSTLPAGP